MTWKVEEIKNDKNIVAKISSDDELLAIVTLNGDVMGRVGQVKVKTMRGSIEHENKFFGLVGKVKVPVTPSERMKSLKMIQSNRIFDLDWEIKKIKRNKDGIVATIIHDKEIVGIVLQDGIVLGKLGTIKIPFRTKKPKSMKVNGLRYDAGGEISSHNTDTGLKKALDVVSKLMI